MPKGKRYTPEQIITKLREAEILLTLAIAFLYLWLVTTGVQIIHRGQRHLIDCNSRRDLSIFQTLRL